MTLADVRRLAEELADELAGDDYRRARVLLTAIDFLIQNAQNARTSVEARQHADPGDEA